MSEARIEPSWRAALADELAAPYMDEVRQVLVREQELGRTVYPPRAAIFRAFDLVPVDAARVVIVGQDPYHGPGQAMGLSFSVPQGVDRPPSLRNILREAADDVGATGSDSGDLTPWTRQGVLLLNSALTVRAGAAGSHAKIGWHRFTDAAIRHLAEQREGLAFLLWGRHARSKTAMIDRERHLVLEAPHPSPLSASSGFFGCRHFSMVNEHLAARGEAPIDWSLDG